MSSKNIYIDYNSSLAYKEQPEQVKKPTKRPMITVTTKAQALEKQRRIQRNERIFALGAAGTMLFADGALFAMILKIGSLIGMQTGSLAAAGCYLVGMGFFTLMFLENTARNKRSAFLDGLAHIWRVICTASAITLVIYCALRSPDSGGSILLTSLVGFAVRLHFKG